MVANADVRSIPWYASRIVGRESEIDLISSMVRDSAIRLITITGTAGIGKTRLVSQIARDLQNSDADVVFVPLALVDSPALVMAEISQALETQPGEIKARLAETRGIVVLDNFEQVIDAATDIAAILPDNPELTILVTSQRPLQIDGEHIVRLQPLAIPESNTSAEELLSIPSVELLIGRAIQHDISQKESLQDAGAARTIGQICQRLEGIPLSIELAASRLAVLTPEVVLEKLEHGQSILSYSRRDLPDRQRTMHAAIAWSFDLLPEESRPVFLWLGAFTAGFDLDIVDRVAARLEVSQPAIDIVESLVNASLIQRIQGGASPWYSMLMSIREFCLAELDDRGARPDAEKLVAEYVLDMVERSDEHIVGAQSAAWRSHLNRELSTIRSAVSWSIDHEEPLLPMMVAGNLTSFILDSGMWQEVCEWIDRASPWAEDLDAEHHLSGLVAQITLLSEGRAFERAEAAIATAKRLLTNETDPELRNGFYLAMGLHEQNLHHNEEAQSWYRQVLHLARQKGFVRDEITALANLGTAAFHMGDQNSAEVHFVQAKELMESVGDHANLTMMLSNLATLRMGAGDMQTAMDYLDQAEVLEIEHGLKRSHVFTLANRFSIYWYLGDPESAFETGEEAWALATELGDREMASNLGLKMAWVSLSNGDNHRSAAYLLGAITDISSKESVETFAEGGWMAAGLLIATGKHAEAAELMGKTMQFAVDHQFVFDGESRAGVEKNLAELEEALPDFESRFAAGAAWDDAMYAQKLRLHAQRLSRRNAGIVMSIPSPTQTDAGIADELTNREREILQLLIDGQSTQGMAEHLSLSPRTVTTHLGNIMGKMGVSSRTELVAKVLRQNKG